jgi:hypothetical protein
LSGFPSFSFQCIVKNCRTCKRLREFEEIEISRQVTVNNKEKNSVWISSKNSAPEISRVTVNSTKRKTLSGFRPRIQPKKSRLYKKAKVLGIIMSCFIVQHVQYTEQVVHSLLIKSKRRAVETTTNPSNREKPG